MKVVIVTVFILIIFLLGSFMLNQYISISCELLLEEIEGLYELVKDEEWILAKGELLNFEDQWKNIKKRWELFVEHYEMDTIDIAIARLGQYVEIEESVGSLGEIAELKLLIGHVKEKEAFKLGNVL